MIADNYTRSGRNWQQCDLNLGLSESDLLPTLPCALPPPHVRRTSVAATILTVRRIDLQPIGVHGTLMSLATRLIQSVGGRQL